MKRFLLVLTILFTISVSSQNIGAFYLSRYSPVIDRGTMDVYYDVQGTDYYGNPRFQGRSIDMGAAEYQDMWPRIVNAKVNEDMTIFRGSSVELMASGGENYTWSTGETTRVITVSPDVTTTYTVTVDESGTISETQVTINVVSPIIDRPIANIGNDVVECFGQQILLSANGSPTATYVWSTGETTKDIVVQLTETVIIYVEITDGDIMVKDYVAIYVNQNCN